MPNFLTSTRNTQSLATELQDLCQQVSAKMSQQEVDTVQARLKHLVAQLESERPATAPPAVETPDSEGSGQGGESKPPQPVKEDENLGERPIAERPPSA
jgi:hypothetical protein